MGLEGDGVEPAADCGGARGDRRGRQPVDAARTRGWRGGPEAPAAPRSRAETDAGAAGADLGAAGAGAEAFGFRGDVWTAKRVATVIRREFGVRYHPNHVGKLLRAAGWSVQKPIERASQRDEAAIEVWRTERWPARKRGLTRRAGPSSGSTNRASTSSRARSGPTLRAGRRRSSACP